MKTLSNISSIFFTLLIIASSLAANAQVSEAYVDEGIKKYETGDYLAAVSEFDKAVEYDPKNASAFLYRGQTYYRIGNKGQALDDLAKAAQLNRNNYKAYYHRARIFFESGDYEYAKNNFTNALKIEPTLYEGYVMLGKSHFGQQNYTMAMKAYNGAIKLEPIKSMAFRNRAVLFLTLGKYEKAIKDYNTLIKHSPDTAGYYFERAKIYQLLEEHHFAIRDFTAAWELGYESEELLSRRAATYVYMDDFERALKDYESIEAQFGADDDLYMKKGQACLSQGNTDDAIRAFNKAISIKEKKAYYVMLAQTYAQKEQHEYVLDNFNKAIELDPKDHDIYYQRAVFYFDRRKIANALADCSVSLKLGDSKEAYFLQGKCYYLLNDHKEVCRSLRKAAELGHSEAREQQFALCYE